MLVWKPGLLYHLIQLDVLKDSPQPLPSYFKIDLMESSNSKSFDWIVPSIEPCKYLDIKKIQAEARLQKTLCNATFLFWRKIQGTTTWKSSWYGLAYPSLANLC